MFHRVLCAFLLLTIAICSGLSASADQERAEISMLIVFYPESYTGYPTRVKINYFHHSIAEYQFWMRWALGDTVDFRYDLVQIERPIGPYDLLRDAQGYVRLPRARVEADLAARGVSSSDYAAVLAFYNWNDVNAPIESRIAPGAHIEGRFASQGIFWPKEPQIGVPEHVTRELLRAAFADVGLESAIPPSPTGPEGLLRAMADVVQRTPGYFASAGAGDDQIRQDLETLKGGESDEVQTRLGMWSQGHIPHLLDKAQLRLVTGAQWLALADRFGKRVDAPASIRVEPLYRRMQAARGSLVWNPFAVIDPDGRSVAGAKGYLWSEKSTQQRGNSQRQGYDAKYGGDTPLFSYGIFVLAIDRPGASCTLEVRADVGEKTCSAFCEFVPKDFGMVSAPAAVAVWSENAERSLLVRLVRQAYGGDPPIAGSVQAKIEPVGSGAASPILKDLAPSSADDGYTLDLSDVGVGEYRVTLSGESDAAVVEDIAIHLAVLPWVLYAPEWVTCRVNEPVTIAPRLRGDVGEGESAVHAAVGLLTTKNVSDVKTAEDGSLTATFTKAVPGRARITAVQNGRLMRPTRDFSVNVIEKGVYEGEDLVAGANVNGGRCKVDLIAVHHPQQAQAWGNGRQLLFTPDAPGGWVEVTLVVPEEGDYAISGTFCGSDGQGIFTVALDGGVPGEPLDSYGPTYSLTDKIDLAQAHLTKGPHTLRFTVVDKAAESLGHALGIDRIFLRKG